MRRFLITGGAGFMGSDFIRYIFSMYSDVEIMNVDKLTYSGNLENLLCINDNLRYHFVQADISDSPMMDLVFRDFKPDIIINFAAESHNDRALSEPVQAFVTNLVGTHVLLETSLRYKIKHFHQISTDEVYGSIVNGRFTELNPLEPNSPYAVSKAAADVITEFFWNKYSLPITISRSCNNYGPYQYPEKIVPLFVTNLIEDKKVPVYDDGTHVREWIFVRDHSEAVDKIIRHGKLGEIYNVGTGEELTNIELTKKILKLLSKNDSNIAFVSGRLVDDYRYAVDSSKLNSLGWRPRYKLEDGLIETVRWYTENSLWWKQIKSKSDFLDLYQKQIFDSL